VSNDKQTEVLWYAGQNADSFFFLSCSASPLNGEAALLWDSNQEEFKRKVLARHVEPSELEDN
jgi:hypothetical protein